MARRVVISDDSSSSSSDDMPTTTTAQREDREIEISSDSDTSDSDDDTSHNDLIDLEAQESGDDEEEDFDDSVADHVPEFDFPQFMKLPYELRIHIWESLCPDLYGLPQVLYLDVLNSARPDIGWYPTDGVHLINQTQDLRAVLAVHQESRRFALTKFPDSFQLNYPDDDHVVPFNKENDIIYLYRGYPATETAMPEPAPANFCAEIQNLALQSFSFPAEDDDSVDIRETLDLVVALQFPNLKTLYAHRSLDYVDAFHTWIQSDHCAWTKVVSQAAEDDLDQAESATLLCFHKAIDCDATASCSTLAYTKTHGFLEPEDDSYRRFSSEDDPVDGVPDQFEHARQRMQSIRKLPLLSCDNALGGTGKGRVIISKPAPGSSGLKIVTDLGLSDGSDSEGGFDEEENDYESEGIDDDPIPDPETEDEEQGTGIEDDTLAMELLSHSPAAGGFSPLQYDESDTLDGSNSDGSAPASPSKRSRARRVVLDDSDEDEEAEAEPTSRGRKRQRVVSDEDEEDDSDDVRPAKRRAPLVEDDSDVEEIEVRPRGNRRTPIVLESDESDEDDPAGRLGPESSEEDEEDESSEEDEPARPLTLAERLRMHREANPIPPGSDEDEDGTDDSHGGYNEDSEDEDEDSGGALVADMAEDDSNDGSNDDDDDDRHYR